VIKHFEDEIAILTHTDHPGVVRMIGYGRAPRMFIVLEYLKEGTLDSMLSRNNSQSSVGRMLFPKKTFQWPVLLSHAIELAKALKYLHHDCISGASIIHRDLKPDNIGFIDGKLKLFDMGLSICVEKESCVNDAYNMSGFIGTLRYMAPEVLLNEKYSEKADVYSFGILLWQMASDKLPYGHIKQKQDFIDRFLIHHDRPTLAYSWPKELKDLLKMCWDKDQHKRPSFELVIELLVSLQRKS
jgi:serine/threonine protein kinase